MQALRVAAGQPVFIAERRVCASRLHAVDHLARRASIQTHRAIVLAAAAAVPGGDDRDCRVDRRNCPAREPELVSGRGKWLPLPGGVPHRRRLVRVGTGRCLVCGAGPGRDSRGDLLARPAGRPGGGRTAAGAVLSGQAERAGFRFTCRRLSAAGHRQARLAVHRRLCGLRSRADPASASKQWRLVCHLRFWHCLCQPHRAGTGAVHARRRGVRRHGGAGGDVPAPGRQRADPIPQRVCPRAAVAAVYRRRHPRQRRRAGVGRRCSQPTHAGLCLSLPDPGALMAGAGELAQA